MAWKLWKHPKTKVYYARLQTREKDIKRSLHTTKKGEATEFVRQLDAKQVADDLGLSMPTGKKDLKDAVEAFLEDVEINVSRRWAYDCKLVLNRVVAFWASKRKKYVKDLTLPMVKTYRTHRLKEKAFAANAKMKGLGKRSTTGKPVSRSTVNMEATIIHKLVKFCIDQEWLPQSAIWSLPRLPVKEKPIKYLSRDQVHHLLEVAEKHGTEIHAYIAIAAHTGFRNSSIVGMTWGHIDPNAGRISAPAKGGKLITVKLSSALAEILKDYGEDTLEKLSKTHRNEWLFPAPSGTGHVVDLRKSFEKVAKAAKLDWVTPHVLRHTFGSLLAQEGVPIQQIANLMGHSDVRVTMKHYAALLPSNLDTAIDKLNL